MKLEKGVYLNLGEQKLKNIDNIMLKQNSIIICKYEEETGFCSSNEGFCQTRNGQSLSPTLLLLDKNFTKLKTQKNNET